MRRFAQSMAFSALLASGVPAVAQDTAAPRPNDVIRVIGKKDPAERKICQMEIATGSIVARRVCKTQAEVDEQHRNAETTHANLQQVQEEHLRIARAREGQN